MTGSIAAAAKVFDTATKVTPAESRPASRQARAISPRTAESPSGSVILPNASIRYRAQPWDLNRARPCMQWRGFLKWLPGRGFTSAQEANSRPRFPLYPAARGSFAFRFDLRLACLGASLLGRRPNHG